MLYTRGIFRGYETRNLMTEAALMLAVQLYSSLGEAGIGLCVVSPHAHACGVETNGFPVLDIRTYPLDNLSSIFTQVPQHVPFSIHRVRIKSYIYTGY